MRQLTYCQAINEALLQEMDRDPRVIVMGVGAPTRDRVFGSLDGLLERYGPERVIDTPVAEDAMAGIAVGAAMNGLRPVQCHIRVDFLILAMNQIANIMAPAAFGSNGKLKVPLVIRAVVGRGWGQGWQHSKSLHSWFAHLPGLEVMLPTRPKDAKGMLAAAIRSDEPTIFIEHRWCYWAEGDVPEGDYCDPMYGGEVVREGGDLTVAATSWMVVEALQAADILSRKQGVKIEVIDPKVVAPLDISLVADSVSKTGHCVVADNDWTFCGLGAELAAQVYESSWSNLKAPVTRIGWDHVPIPTARPLENAAYCNARDIIQAVEQQLDLSPTDLEGEDFYSHERRFKGPF